MPEVKKHGLSYVNSIADTPGTAHQGIGQKTGGLPGTVERAGESGDWNDLPGRARGQVIAAALVYGGWRRQTLTRPSAMKSSVNAISATAATPKNIQTIKMICSISSLRQWSRQCQATFTHVKKASLPSMS